MLAFVPGDAAAAAVMTWRRAGENGDGRPVPAPAAATRRSWPGLLVGVLTGFFGVGGGFVIVPVLTIWLGVPFRRAVGDVAGDHRR